MSFNSLIQTQAVNGIKRITRSVKNLESNQAFPIMTGTGTVSNPPTTSEINAIFDTPANVGQDFIGFIIDSVNGYEFLVWTDGVSWYVISQASTTYSGARVDRGGSTQSVGSGSNTDMQYTTVVFDTDSYFNLANPERLTASKSGLYAVSGFVTWQINGNGVRKATLFHWNGISNLPISVQGCTASGFTGAVGQGLSYDAIIYMNAGDYVSAKAYQDSGSNKTIQGTLSIARIG